MVKASASSLCSCGETMTFTSYDEEGRGDPGDLRLLRPPLVDEAHRVRLIKTLLTESTQQSPDRG